MSLWHFTSRSLIFQKLLLTFLMALKVICSTQVYCCICWRRVFWISGCFLTIPKCLFTEKASRMFPADQSVSNSGVAQLNCTVRLISSYLVLMQFYPYLRRFNSINSLYFSLFWAITFFPSRVVTNSYSLDSIARDCKHFTCTLLVSTGGTHSFTVFLSCLYRIEFFIVWFRFSQVLSHFSESFAGFAHEMFKKGFFNTDQFGGIMFFLYFGRFLIVYHIPHSNIKDQKSSLRRVHLSTQSDAPQPSLNKYIMSEGKCMLQEAYHWLISHNQANCIRMLTLSFTSLRRYITQQLEGIQQLCILMPQELLGSHTRRVSQHKESIEQMIEEFNQILVIIHNEADFSLSQSGQEKLEIAINSKLQYYQKKQRRLAKTEINVVIDTSKKPGEERISKEQYKKLLLCLAQCDEVLKTPPMCFKVSKLQHLSILGEERAHLFSQEKRQCQMGEDDFEQISSQITKQIQAALRKMLEIMDNQLCEFEQIYIDKLNEPQFNELIGFIRAQYKKLAYEVKKSRKQLNRKEIESIRKVVSHFRTIIRDKQKQVKDKEKKDFQFYKNNVLPEEHLIEPPNKNVKSSPLIQEKLMGSERKGPKDKKDNCNSAQSPMESLSTRTSMFLSSLIT